MGRDSSKGQPPISINASDAVVEMADMAFVPLRNRFDELREPRRTFAGLVKRYARASTNELSGPQPKAIGDRSSTLWMVLDCHGRYFFFRAER